MEKSICTACEGKGKQTVTFSVFGGGETSHQSTCLWCKGTGKLTPRQALVLKTYNEMWCECKEQHGVTFFKDGEHALLSKHHYRCNVCGGIVQIG